MVRKTIVSVCTLNQWAMDFQGNMERIIQSIQIAKTAGARYRGGPELEISGYTCEDHFLESDTITHSWEVLAEIISSPVSQDIIVDVGMPVIHRNSIYNCRVVFYNKNILLIRPKTLLCDDGNYRESRWFTSWRKIKQIEEYRLPQCISNTTGQSTTVIGDGIIITKDTSIGYEICEELWNPQSSHIPLSFDGVEIIVNGSGSYMELRKAYLTIELIKSATFKTGACYLFNNLRGCDGGRVYFNGCSCIAINGHILARTQQFSLLDVEVATAIVDLDDVSCFRSARRSLCQVSSVESQAYPQVKVDVSITLEQPGLPLTFPITWEHHTSEEEIALGPACWLWDYLRRSGQGGFFLPLSGGIDSASSAVIIYSMCNLIVQYSQVSEVLGSVRKIVSDPNYVPSDAKELCGRIFFTSYMATENSSRETKMRAKQLALQIGSYHIEVNLSGAVTALLNVFSLVTGMKPRFSVHGGSPRECLALQNVQARIRMVMAYLLAQLLLWARGRPGGLLVVGSANVDEALRGYMTKYDCSSADVNPIGGISKTDLRSFIDYAKERFNLSSLDLIQSAPATAELLPLSEGTVVQTDEAEMGLTYDELSCMGRLRKSNRCGPLSTFNRLVFFWKDRTPEEVAEKVKHFYRCYALNRHKMTVLTPSIHAEGYSPDDNRYDLRQFLYSISWRWQFSAIDKQVQALSSSNTNNLYGARSPAKSLISKCINSPFRGGGFYCGKEPEECYKMYLKHERNNTVGEDSIGWCRGCPHSCSGFSCICKRHVDCICETGRNDNHSIPVKYEKNNPTECKRNGLNDFTDSFQVYERTSSTVEGGTLTDFTANKEETATGIRRGKQNKYSNFNSFIQVSKIERRNGLQ